MALSSLIQTGMKSFRAKLCILTEAPQCGMLLGNVNVTQHQQTRSINKHRIPKWKRQRREKYLKTPLPAFEEVRKIMSEEYTPAEVRAFMRQRGAIPYVNSAPIICITDSGQVFDPYVPTEGDGVKSGLFKQKTKDYAVAKANKLRGKREIKKFEENFNADEFAETSLEMYKEIHTLLTKVFPQNFLSQYKDQEDVYRLHDLVTEFAWPDLTRGLENKTLVWRYVESLEPARIVHYCSREMHKKGNRYGQITVRFHSKQIMALYDRFGRLMHGSETVPKDTVDFIIFEKQLSDTLGKWRLHSKVKPDWQLTNQSVVKKTMMTTRENVEVNEESTAVTV